MAPYPIAETSRLLLPSFRFCIVPPSGSCDERSLRARRARPGARCVFYPVSRLLLYYSPRRQASPPLRALKQAIWTARGRQGRTRSERVHLVAGSSDIGDSIRQLRLRHRQRIEAFAQQLDLTSPRHQVPCEQMMEHSPGRRGVRVRHILGERLFRRLDEDTGLVRREREVRVEFEQLPKECGDLAAASVARSDPERGQERQFERPVVREQRRSAVRIADGGEIFQQQSFRVLHLQLLQAAAIGQCLAHELVPPSVLVKSLSLDCVPSTRSMTSMLPRVALE